MRRMYSEKQIEEMSKGIAKEVVQEGIKNGSIDIAEDMIGYSYAKITPADVKFTATEEYISAVKNGNKLTFVIAGIIKVNETPTGFQGAFRFVVPKEIHDKLIPSQFFSGQIIDLKRVTCFASAASAGNPISFRTSKASNNSIDVNIYPTGLTINTDYYFRWEVTFLLSDNWVSNE